MDDQRMDEYGESPELSALFVDREETRQPLRVLVQPVRAANGEIVLLHVLATYRFSVNTQESFGFAWTTEADGRTPVNVGSLTVTIEVAGSTQTSPTRRNVSRNSVGTRGAFDEPQRVRAIAVSTDPDIEVEDTTDD